MRFKVYGFECRKNLCSEGLRFCEGKDRSNWNACIYIYIINLFMYLFMYLFVCIFTFMYKANKTKPGFKHSRFGPLGSFGML